MYASYRTVSKSQGWDDTRRRQSALNRLRHRGMQKAYIQITPDGKVIQHYRMDARMVAGKKLLQEALNKMNEEATAAKQAQEANESSE